MSKQIEIDKSDPKHPVIRKKTTYTNQDVERLYDAFVKLCDYIETGIKDSCEKCPHKHICFGWAGNEFQESLQRIKEDVK